MPKTGEKKKRIIKASGAPRGGNTKAQALAFAVLRAMEKGEIKNKADLLREAGYSEMTVHARPSDPWNTMTFKRTLAENGVTADTVQAVYKDAMDAKQGSWFKGEYKTSTEADHAMRMRAADSIAKLTGLEINRTQNTNINVDVPVEDALQMLGI